MNETNMDYYEIDNAILSINRVLNENLNDNVTAIDEEMDKLKYILNEYFFDVMPLKYQFFSLFPKITKSMKTSISLYLLSHSLCIEFPNLVNKRLNMSLLRFEKFLEQSWPNRTKVVYDGENGTITYIIQLIHY